MTTTTPGLDDLIGWFSSNEAHRVASSAAWRAGFGLTADDVINEAMLRLTRRQAPPNLADPQATGRALVVFAGRALHRREMQQVRIAQRAAQHARRGALRSSARCAVATSTGVPRFVENPTELMEMRELLAGIELRRSILAEHPASTERLQALDVITGLAHRSITGAVSDDRRHRRCTPGQRDLLSVLAEVRPDLVSRDGDDALTRKRRSRFVAVMRAEFRSILGAAADTPTAA